MIFIGGNALDTPEGLVASQITVNLLNTVIFRDGRTVRFTVGSVSPEVKNYQVLDEVQQNTVICLAQADHSIFNFVWLIYLHIFLFKKGRQIVF
jgi:hypothetical protein